MQDEEKEELVRNSIKGVFGCNDSKNISTRRSAVNSMKNFLQLRKTVEYYA